MHCAVNNYVQPIANPKTIALSTIQICTNAFLPWCALTLCNIILQDTYAMYPACTCMGHKSSCTLYDCGDPKACMSSSFIIKQHRFTKGCGKQMRNHALNASHFWQGSSLSIKPQCMHALHWSKSVYCYSVLMIIIVCIGFLPWGQFYNYVFPRAEYI